MRTPQTTDRESQEVAVAVQNGYHVEHNTDDTHKIIHASGSIFERGRTSYALGDSISVPFRPSDYSANGAMTWTVLATVVTNISYALIGPRMIYDVFIYPAAIGGVANTRLLIKIPDGFYAKRDHINMCGIVDNGAQLPGLIIAVKNSNMLQVGRYDGGNFTVGANAGVFGQICLEVGTA